jgi:uncharacterized protein (TIGR02271 family)
MAHNSHSSNTGDLVRLRDSDFDVADGYPDIRGYEVVDPAGRKLGKVKDLVVSPAEMRVRYVDVDVDNSLRTSGQGDHALVPIGAVDIDESSDSVRVSSLANVDLASYPRYSGEITSDYESSLRSFRGGATGAVATGTAASLYDHDDYDHDRAFAGRRRDTKSNVGDQKLTLSEEELRIGKQQHQAGEVGVRKTVETEHVSESVPLMHEEVTIDRRPLTGAAAGNVEIGGDQEIHVPVMREEAVVEKRAVAKEQVIIRKTQRTENQTVEADLRRERLEVDNDTATLGGSAASGTSTSGRTGAGLGDRISNAVDNVKDRVDGNPASRPGPDATDRR